MYKVWFILGHSNRVSGMSVFKITLSFFLFKYLNTRVPVQKPPPFVFAAPFLSPFPFHFCETKTRTCHLNLYFSWLKSDIHLFSEESSVTHAVPCLCMTVFWHPGSPQNSVPLCCSTNRHFIVRDPVKVEKKAKWHQQFKIWIFLCFNLNKFTLFDMLNDWQAQVSFVRCPVSYTHLTLPTICSV